MIIEPNIEALRVALVNGYVEDTLIDGLSTQEIASALQALFDVTATDMMAHPDYHGDLMTLENVPPLFRRGLLTAIVEQGVTLSAHMRNSLVPLSLVPCLAFKASDLWSHISADFPIIASRVYRLATGKMSYIVPAIQRTMLQEAAKLPSSHPSVEVARQATYEAVLRSNFPMAIEEPENEDVDGLEEDLAPDSDYHEGAPLALEVIAGLQPSHVEAAFDWTTNSSVGRRAIAATVATEHAFTHHGADSAQELLARIEYLQNDNKMFSIEKAVQTQFPNAPQSDFYSEYQMKQYNEYMFTCRGLQTSLKTHVLPTAVRQDLEALLQRTANSAAALWVTARIGFAGATAFRNATGTGGEESYLAVYAPQLAVANEAQRAEAAHAAKRPKYPSFSQGAGQNYQGLTPFVKGGGGWNNSWADPGLNQQARKKAQKRAAGAAMKGGKAAALNPTVWCFSCGAIGHKSNECYNSTGYPSAAPSAPAQTWGGASEDYNWQSQPEAELRSEQAFPALGWHDNWQSEANQNARPANQNARPASFQNTGRGAGKTGGKSFGGKSNYGGYKGQGDPSSSKGGGKSWGGSTGGRGGGAYWPGHS